MNTVALIRRRVQPVPQGDVYELTSEDAAIFALFRAGRDRRREVERTGQRVVDRRAGKGGSS